MEGETGETFAVNIVVVFVVYVRVLQSDEEWPIMVFYFILFYFVII